jgi:beta-lactamase regulating signal transducer with metallopeptidase domain
MIEFPTVMTAIGHALLHFLWQGALIGVLAALALQALREAQPQVRYTVACFALLACVLAPLSTFIAQLAAASPEPLFGAALTTTPHLVAAPQVRGPLFGLVSPPEQFSVYLPWIVALWAAGASVMSLRIAMGLMWIQRMRNTPQGELQATWQARLDAMAVHFGLRRGVALRLVDDLDTPVSAGWWRPVVLLPLGLLTRMPTDLIEALLAHELAHIRRHDYLVNLLQNAVEALLFYHPVTWWLSRRVRAEREQIADQLAAEVACAPRRLAVALYELSEIPRSHPTLHLAQAARGGQLMSRIEQLIRPTRRAQPSARIVFPLLGLAAACIATYAYAQTTRPQPQQVAVATSLATQPAQKTKGLRITRDSRDTFAFVPGDGGGISMWGSSDELPAIETARRSLKSDFLWASRAGKDYVVTDPAMLVRAREAWRETDAIGQKMEALGSQMEVHGRKMEALGKRLEVLNQQHDDPAAKRREADFERQQRDLVRQQRELEKLLRDAPEGDTQTQERVTHRMEALSEQLAQLLDKESDAVHADAERNQQPFDALSREMEEASKPMDELGKQMDALGREHEKAANQAERELQALVTEALTKGLAKPAPATKP